LPSPPPFTASRPAAAVAARAFFSRFFAIFSDSAKKKSGDSPHDLTAAAAASRPAAAASRPTSSTEIPITLAARPASRDLSQKKAQRTPGLPRAISVEKKRNRRRAAASKKAANASLHSPLPL
jgi:hypothetical protein